MKSAEEWIKSWTRSTVSDEDIETHLQILRQIQLDAWKQGMKDAANIALEDSMTRIAAKISYMAGLKNSI